LQAEEGNMKRLSIIVAASIAMLAAAPASSLARTHHRHHSRSHHARKHHHAHVRLRRFGSLTPTSGAATTPTPAGTAGTIDTFDGTTLTITLNNLTSVSGMVTPATEIVCESPATATAIHADGDGGSTDGSDGSVTTAGPGPSSGSDDTGEATGDDTGDDDAGEEAGATAPCSTASLIHGAVVRGAELRIGSAGPVWDKIELVG
jgi:hypothetical protein